MVFELREDEVNFAAVPFLHLLLVGLALIRVVLNSFVLFQLFLHFWKLLIPLEAREEELFALRARCEQKPDAGVAQVDVKHA